MKKGWFIKSFFVGSGIAVGLLTVTVLAVTVGTVKTWTSGETLTSSDLNSTISSLKTALEAIPNWTKSGTNAVYTEGNVGIGTTNPVTLLNVYKSGVVGNYVRVAGDAGGWGGISMDFGGTLSFIRSRDSGAIEFFAGDASTIDATILSNGNVGIGTSTPGYKLHSYCSSGTPYCADARIENSVANSIPGLGLQNDSRSWSLQVRGDLSGASDNGFSIRDETSATYRFFIDTTGNVGIGTNSPTNPFQMASGAYVTTGGVWTNASSRKYKENFQDISAKEALATVMALDPQKFNYKSDKSEKHVGFIAEDVPDLVATKDRKGLSAIDIVAVLTKVVQQQQREIDELKLQISSGR